MKIFFLIIVVFNSALLYSQSVQISDQDFTTSGQGNCPCSSVFSSTTDTNFHDTGLGDTLYQSNENEVITFCPDASGSKVSILLSNFSPFRLDIDPSDTLYVYDGISTTAPLIEKFNNNYNASGGSFRASFTNTSGCLTIQFVSDAAVQDTGWVANISCSNVDQPFEAHMEAFIGNGAANGQGDAVNDLTPSDTGYVDICMGDSIMFVATPDFPYEPGGTLAPDFGGGYDQSNNHTSEWEFSDGTLFIGDTVWFTPLSFEGYYVTLRITDSHTLYETIVSKIRISTKPIFSVYPSENDLCIGDTSVLVGWVNGINTDTLLTPVTGAFPIGGDYGTQTYLPDGSGANYQAPITISGFNSGATVQNASDIYKICVNMEHSFLGDLEMKLTCPNGQSMQIFDAYNGPGTVFGELFNGGFNGGGTYIGGAYDNNTGNIGVCEEYCFSVAPNALPGWATTFNTVPASGPSSGSMIEPGTYNPGESFFPALQGCPVNGNWTITVRDNQTIDDGYICSWGIYFDSYLHPDGENYTVDLVNGNWLPDNTIINNNIGDSGVVVKPDTSGTFNYTFEVTDEYGCVYDTTVIVTVVGTPEVMPIINTCLDSTAIVDGTVSILGGYWFINGPGNATFVDGTSNTNLNPHVMVDESGSYLFNFVDLKCEDTVVTIANFFLNPTVEIVYEGATNVDRVAICKDDQVTLKFNATDSDTFTWDPFGYITSDDSVTVYGNQNLFTVTNGSADSILATITASGMCGIAEDEIMIVVQECEIPNVITPNGDGINDYFYTSYAEFYTDVELVIYNRWGKVVFKTDSYQNDWSGQRKESNQQVSSGTYYYVMRWNEGTKDASGTITVFDSK